MRGARPSRPASGRRAHPSPTCAERSGRPPGSAYGSVMQEERIEAAGVPAKLYDPGDARGLLLLGHGGGSTKDDDLMVSLGRELAEGTRLRVVCIDAVGHGERADGGDVRRTMGSE